MEAIPCISYLRVRATLTWVSFERSVERELRGIFTPARYIQQGIHSDTKFQLVLNATWLNAKSVLSFPNFKFET